MNIFCMELPSALPVTAPLFFIAAERFLPNDVNPAGAIYGAACGALGAVALYGRLADAHWPGRARERRCER